MGYAFFAISVADPEAGQRELNAFLASHRSTSVRMEFVANGESSCWAVAVGYLRKAGVQEQAAGKRATKVDWKEELAAGEFAVFCRLKDLRKELAEAEGAQLYTIFTNEQLAQMVQQRVDSLTALKRIDGIGEAKAAKYGERFLGLLREAGL